MFSFQAKGMELKEEKERSSKQQKIRLFLIVGCRIRVKLKFSFLKVS